MTVYLSALAGAGAQFFTSGGVPLAGGKIYTYQAGTTTPATTWQDSAGATANTNPIILDSAGRPAATGGGNTQIWLASTTNYKFILTTSADVVLWTQDNIPGVAGASAFAALLGSGGAAYIGFIQGGTGAVATNLQERERRFVFLTDFIDMATYVPGTTDVTTPLTNALARCAATGQAKTAATIASTRAAAKMGDLAAQQTSCRGRDVAAHPFPIALSGRLRRCRFHRRQSVAKSRRRSAPRSRLRRRRK